MEQKGTKEIVLDDAAEELFRELGGTDARVQKSDYDLSGLTETLHDQDRRMDPWILLLVEFTQEISEFIRAWRQGSLREAEAAIAPLGTTLAKLNRIPGHDGAILIRHQGRGIPGEGRASMGYDYVVQLGAARADIPKVRATARRIGYTASDYPAMFTSGLSHLSEYGITTLRFVIGEQDARYVEKMKKCLTVLGAYFRIKASLERAGEGAVKEKDRPFIMDETGRPDPNLALLAVMNGQKKEAVQQLVNKVLNLWGQAGMTEELDLFPNVYEALFAFKKIKNMFSRPLIEVNNLKWLLLQKQDEDLPSPQGRVVRLAGKIMGERPLAAARLVDCLYARDFSYANSYQVVDRAVLATELLAAIDRDMAEGPVDETHHGCTLEVVKDNVLDVVEDRLDRVKDDILEDLEISGSTVITHVGKKKDRFAGDVDEWILAMLAFYRQRAKTKKKIKSMLTSATRFDEVDYDTLSRDFGVEVDAARELVRLLKGCFDQERHFVRGTFEKTIPAFTRHEDKVFEFLWHFLKEHTYSNERISFLNSMKVLIDRMKQPDRAMQVLLEDFSRDPETVTFSDRNALMLTNILLRKFNQELNRDVEMTPEEVLNVQEGLNRDVVAFARDMIDRDKELFYLKFRHIHRKLREVLEGDTRKGAMPARYLFTLEREVYMLFALIGGITGGAILRSGLREYGDQDFGMYELKNSKLQLNWLFQILQVVVRGVGRIGGPDDVVTLNEITPRTTYFKNLGEDARHLDQVKRVMGWVDKTLKRLKEMNPE